jgi:hypothetical protein
LLKTRAARWLSAFPDASVRVCNCAQFLSGEENVSNQKPQRYLNLTRNELTIIVVLGGLLLCVLAVFGIYIMYDLSRPLAVAAAPSAIPQTESSQTQLQSPSPHPVAYPTLPAEWTATSNPGPSATKTPQPTVTTGPSNTPAPTNTPGPTLAPPATATAPVATFNNPVPIGTSYTWPGTGTLTVKKSDWKPGQTGYAIVLLSFSCERPADQTCDTGHFLLHAVGGSGNGYSRGFDTAIPEPGFGSFTNPPPHGGGHEEGYAGFLITSSETTLAMQVGIFLQDGEWYFKLSK